MNMHVYIWGGFCSTSLHMTFSAAFITLITPPLHCSTLLFPSPFNPSCSKTQCHEWVTSTGIVTIGPIDLQISYSMLIFNHWSSLSLRTWLKDCISEDSTYLSHRTWGDRYGLKWQQFVLVSLWAASPQKDYFYVYISLLSYLCARLSCHCVGGTLQMGMALRGYRLSKVPVDQFSTSAPKFSSAGYSRNHELKGHMWDLSP